MLKTLIHKLRPANRSPRPEENRRIEQYINAYHTFLNGPEEISLDCLENIHRGISSSLHGGAATDDIMVSTLLYSALRLPGYLDRVSRVVIGPNEGVFRTGGYGNINSWETAPAQARRRKALFNGSDTLAVFTSSVSDIDDLMPALCAYQIEWNKMHKRLEGTALGQNLKSGLIKASAIGDKLKTTLGMSSADHEMLAKVWGDRWDEKIAAIAAAPKNFRVKMLSSDHRESKREVQKWWSDLLEHFHDVGIEDRPLYLVSSNTHSLANLISGFAYRYRHESVAHALKNDTEGLLRQWKRLRDEEEEAKLNFYYCAQRAFGESDSKWSKIQHEMEEEAGLQRFIHDQLLDQETQIIDLSRIQSDCIDSRLDRSRLSILKRSRALILNIDYPLGFSAYHIMSQVAQEAKELRGVYIMGKSASMLGRVGDIMIPSEISDEHTKNQYIFKNCFSVRNLVGYLRDVAVFDDQRSVSVRGTFLHSWDSIKQFHKKDFTGIEMEAGPYLSALYEYIHGHSPPRESLVEIKPTPPFDIGILHYSSDIPYNVRASLLSSRMGYVGLEATYTCTLAILQSILDRETGILKAE